MLPQAVAGWGRPLQHAKNVSAALSASLLCAALHPHLLISLQSWPHEVSSRIFLQAWPHDDLNASLMLPQAVARRGRAVEHAENVSAGLSASLLCILVCSSPCNHGLMSDHLGSSCEHGPMMI